MTLKFGHKRWFIFVISILLLTDIAILLNIPFLRQVIGFLFLTLLPGLLILLILKLNKVESTEKFVLSVGLSISFLMFFGLLINNLSLSLNYETPLATIPLLISFNIAFVVLAIVGYRRNKNSTFSLPNLNLSTSEKAFLIIPVFFPALSIFGMYVMNTTDNNIILMILLFLIPIYVAFVCFFNQKFSNRLYPVVIFLISMSLLLRYPLRFPYIQGNDIHLEYYFFRTVVNNLHWSIGGHGLLDACLSISLLPAIFQSILNANVQEYLFKGVYVSICSFGPLAIYVMSKKYIGDSYAFLASFFFMAQVSFLNATRCPRFELTVFFAALALMVFFSDKIDPLKRRILFIIFILSMVVSHYSTTYIFFFIILFTWLVVEILSKIHTLNKKITLTLALLFFAFIFFWYSQVTEVPFNSGVSFFENTFSDLNKYFVDELKGHYRDPGFLQLAGKGLEYGIVSKAHLIVTWCTFILIGIGVVTMLKRYKEMVSIRSNIKHKKSDFLNTKFEMEYLIMALAGVGFLVSMITLPHTSTGYQPARLYLLVVIILSTCFIIGGMALSNLSLNLLRKVLSKMLLGKKALPKKQKEGRKGVIEKAKGNRKSDDEKNTSQVRAYLIILLVLIPYFLLGTGPIHQLFGYHNSIILNPVENVEAGPRSEYIYDQESYAAKWLKGQLEKNNSVYITGTSGSMIDVYKIINQAEIPESSIKYRWFLKRRKIDGLIYLNYLNVVDKETRTKEGIVNLSDYADIFIGKNRVYDNGGSEIWR